MFGIRNTKRYLALASLCLVAASVTAQAQASVPLLVPSVSTTLNTASFKFTTSLPTKAVISIGTDKTYGLTVLDRSKTSHWITVRSLRPATTYYYAVRATPAKSKPMAKTGSFMTNAPGSVPATMTTQNNKVLINGVPSFLMMVDGWVCPTQQVIHDNAAMGLSIFAGVLATSCPDADPAQGITSLHDMLAANKAWWLGIGGDNGGTTQADLPELLNWEGSGISFISNIPSLVGCNDHSTGVLYRNTLSLARSRPVVYHTLLFDISSKVKNCINAPRLQSLFRTVVVAGASGVKFVTEPQATPAGLSISQEVQDQSAKLASEVATLGPVILNGAPLMVKTNPASAVKVRGWLYGGVMYFLAVNTEGKPAAATFSTTGLNGQATVQVLGENRVLKVANGVLADQFESLDSFQGSHWYKVLPPAPLAKK